MSSYTSKLLFGAATLVMLFAVPALSQDNSGGQDSTGQQQSQQAEPQGQSQMDAGANGTAEELKTTQGAEGTKADQDVSKSADDTQTGKSASETSQSGDKANKKTGQAESTDAADSTKSDDAAKKATGETTGEANTKTTDDAAKKTDETAKADEPADSTKITTEHRTVIQETIVKEKVKPVDLDIKVSIGTVIPSTVVLHPLPPRIVKVVPRYRGYRFFVLADGTIVIVEPGSHAVVTVIRA